MSKQITTVPNDSQYSNIDIKNLGFNISNSVIPQAFKKAHKEYTSFEFSEETLLQIANNDFDVTGFINDKIDNYVNKTKEILSTFGVVKSASVYKAFKSKEFKVILNYVTTTFIKNDDDQDGGVEVKNEEIMDETNILSKSQIAADFDNTNQENVTPADRVQSEDHFTIDPHKIIPLDDNTNDEFALSRKIIQDKVIERPNVNMKDKNKLLFPKLVSVDDVLSCSYITLTILNFSGLAGVSFQVFDSKGNLMWTRTMPQTYISIPKGSGLLLANIFSSDVNRDVSEDTDDESFYLQRYSSTSCITHFLTPDDMQDAFDYVFGRLCTLDKKIYQPTNIEQLISRLITAVIVLNVLSPYDLPIDYIINDCEFKRGSRNYKRCFSHLSLTNSPTPISDEIFNAMSLEISDDQGKTIGLLNPDEICYLKDSDYPIGPGLIAVMGTGGSGKSVLANSAFIKKDDKLLETEVMSLGEPGKVFNIMNIQNLSTILNTALSQNKPVVVDSLRLMMLTGQLGVGKGGISKEITNLLTYIDTIAHQAGIPFIVITNPMEDSSEVINILFHALKSVASTTIMTKQVSKYINNSLQIDAKISTRLGYLSDFIYDRSPREVSIIINEQPKQQVENEDVVTDDRYIF